MWIWIPWGYIKTCKWQHVPAIPALGRWRGFLGLDRPTISNSGSIRDISKNKVENNWGTHPLSTFGLCIQCVHICRHMHTCKKTDKLHLIHLPTLDILFQWNLKYMVLGVSVLSVAMFSRLIHGVACTLVLCSFSWPCNIHYTESLHWAINIYTVFSWNIYKFVGVFLFILGIYSRIGLWGHIGTLIFHHSGYTEPHFMNRL